MTDRYAIWRSAQGCAVVLQIDAVWRWVHGYVRKLADAELNDLYRARLLPGVQPSRRQLELACTQRMGLNDQAAATVRAPADVETWPADVLAFRAREIGRDLFRARARMWRGVRKPRAGKGRGHPEIKDLEALARVARLSSNTTAAVVTAAWAAHEHLRRRESGARERMQELRRLKGAA